MVFTLLRLLVMAMMSLAGYRTVVLILFRVTDVGSPPAPGMQYLVFGAAVGALLGWLIAPLLFTAVKRAADGIVGVIQKIPTLDIVIGAFGLILGMLIGALATFSIPKALPLIGTYLPLLVTLSTGYVGAVVAVRKREELSNLLGKAQRTVQGEREHPRTHDANSVNVLDTSVIIDGRILDICRTGFITGALVVPTVVLEELQHIADSSDTLRRNRGRRGLDILAQIQQLPGVSVSIVKDEFRELAEVDSKLIRVAQRYKGKILTNDYNLNKVAELQGVAVLNINELANAVKPVALPGEEMDVQIIKDGREYAQGVGYLDDGTMIVVDNGKRFMGQTITVIVTNSLQTAAGRMLFAKPKQSERFADVST